MNSVAGESWSPPPNALPLPLEGVHLWRILLDDGDASRAFLSPDERGRADKFVSLQHRNRFVTMRSALRVVLSRYLQIAPASLMFTYGEKGKPGLATEQNSLDLRFNVSHSHGLGIIATTCGSELGMDLETRQKVVDYMAIAKRFFSASEYDGLKEVPDHLRQRAFLRCWTRKESYVKALGKGLACSLSSFSVSVSPHIVEHALVKAACATMYHVSDVGMPDECVAALAIQGLNRPRSCWTYDG